MASSRLRLTRRPDRCPTGVRRDPLRRGGPVFIVVGPRPHSPLEAERFELFLTGHLALYVGAGILLPLWEYIWVLRSPWLLAIVAVCAAQCVVLGVALRLARRGRYQQSITLVCIGNWASRFARYARRAGPVAGDGAWWRWCPSLSPSPTSAWQRGLVFTVITAGCVLAHGCARPVSAILHTWPCKRLAGSRPRSSSQRCRSTPFTSW